jgi:hypothetical protein
MLKVDARYYKGKGAAHATPFKAVLWLQELPTACLRLLFDEPRRQLFAFELILDSGG